ncbi:hypothetical protein [Rubellicoccus peritrichatus]|uniref:Right handed beta helix domain-containing protein n=1 Tax=Rubellicoccus peritrichatus TaxID=3080537 RepID=A0AAQ3LJK4_9BACT|nr:hypothetical protein [Puniceicoccus sp. CR14]WOO43399.1 hypothetical protein RZN69_09890 [Puniceicoccus sp. CR14]
MNMLRTYNYGVSLRDCLIFAMTLLGIASVQAATWNVNPSNYRTELAKVNNGDTVVLANGTYTLNSTDITNITRRSGVTYSGNKYNTIFQSTSGSMKEVKFDGKQDLTLKGIHWKDIYLYLRNCKDHVVDWSQFNNAKAPSGNNDLLQIYLSSGGETKWVNANQNYNVFTLKGIKYNAHADAMVRNNNVKGKLRGAYDISNANSMTSQDNYGERSAGGTSAFATEDHATYHHDVWNLIHRRNTMKGWSDSSSGGSIKIKNVNKVQVYDNTYYTSGLLGRVEPATVSEFQDVYIRNNTINDGDINIWTPNYNPRQVRISNNTVLNGDITATRDVTSSFNWSLSFTWSNGSAINGGVTSNQAKGYNLASVIYQTGNTTL